MHGIVLFFEPIHRTLQFVHHHEQNLSSFILGRTF